MHMKAHLRGRKGSGPSNHKTFHYAAAWWSCDRPALIWACKTPNLPSHFRASHARGTTHSVSYCSSREVLEGGHTLLRKAGSFPGSLSSHYRIKSSADGETKRLWSLWSHTAKETTPRATAPWSTEHPEPEPPQPVQQWSSSHAILVCQQGHQSTTGGLQRWQSDPSAQLQPAGCQEPYPSCMAVQKCKQ